LRAANCDTDQYLVVAKFRESPAMSKQTTDSDYMERFNPKKLKEKRVMCSIVLKSQISSQL
jgi:hypothetical protein